MFFSIVIPTYNPGKYIAELLESISHNKCIDDMEIIISDDCSTESFDVSEFKKLNIRYISNNKHYGYPRNGRQHGAEEAKGDWICFADQDDIFFDNAFDIIQGYIKEHDIKDILFSNFVEEIVGTEKRIIRPAQRGWTHGKFYEKRFWDKYKLKYDDIDFCEDINLSTKVDCITTEAHIRQNKYEQPVYIWRRRNDSLADTNYFANSMPDFVKATAGVIIDYVEKHKDNEELFLLFNVKFISTLLNVFFNFQTNLLSNNKEAMLKTILVFQPIFTKFKEITKFTNSDIVYYINNELIDLYRQVREDNYQQVPFVEKISFQDWMAIYFGQ